MATAQSVGADKVSSEDSTVASSLIRWGGPADVPGDVLVMVGSSFSDHHWMHPPLYAAGFALLVVGITGTYLYLRRSGRFGLSGTVGFYMSVFAFVCTTINSLGVLLNLWGAQWLETLGAVNLLIILGMVSAPRFACKSAQPH